MERWCEKKRTAKGAVVPLDTIWRLAQAWYHDRLDPAWRRKTLEEAQAVFTGVGLTGGFWKLG